MKNIITWIAADKEKPKAEERVFILCQNESGRQYINIGQYIPPKTVRSEDFLSDECEISDLEEYEEETDTYWCLENWFESVTEAEISCVIMDKVLLWAKIPNAKEIAGW